MTKIIKPLVVVVLGLLPFFGFAQTKTILKNDLQKVVEQLSEEQLARLINYAEKLQEEPKESTPTQKKSKKPRPNVFWKTSKYDLGTITQGDILFLPFKYYNTSKEPYIMSNVKSSCGCVSVKLPKEPLKENESNILMLSVDTKKMKAQTHVTVLIYDNSAPNGKSYLSIKANVIEATAHH